MAERAYCGATAKEAWLAPRAWVALLCPAQSLDTLVALASPLAPPHTDSSFLPVIPCPGFIWRAWNHGLSFILEPSRLEAEPCVIRGGVGTPAQLFQ